ncbi:hypothetical protein VTP01DRAFT_1826 [Rhizomucor pusillus]|uniref:uncharacterized protein n=1 Tax=Rhizomucor pusillus TaxID=4840 RepID=UPI00374262C2
MGSADLIKHVESVHQPFHIKEYAGKTLVVDGRAWLWQSASKYAVELATNDKTELYVEAFLERVKLLRSHDVTPIIVFHGKPLACSRKSLQIAHRHRENAWKDGLTLLKQGKREGARKLLEEGLQVTNKMVRRVTEALKTEKIEHIVAPQEADAQLAYFVQTGKAEAALTESDSHELIIYGCSAIVFDLAEDGSAKRVLFKDLSTAKELNLSDWSNEKIKELCMLSGCRDLPSLPGMDLFSAHQLIQNGDRNDATEQISKDIKIDTIKAYYLEYEKLQNQRNAQKVYDDVKTRRSVTFCPRHSAGLADKANVTASAKSKSSKSFQNLRIAFDNKENIPPWLKIMLTCIQDRDNSKHQPAPKVPASTRQHTAPVTTLQQPRKENISIDSNTKANVAYKGHPQRPGCPQKRKSCSDENSENAHGSTADGKARSQKTVKRFGLSDSSNALRAMRSL